MSEAPQIKPIQFDIQSAIGVTVQGMRLTDNTIGMVKVESVHHTFGRPVYCTVNAETDAYLVNYYRLAAAVNGEDVDDEVEQAFLNSTVEEQSPWALKRLAKNKIGRAARNLRKIRKSSGKARKSSDAPKAK